MSNCDGEGRGGQFACDGHCGWEGGRKQIDYYYGMGFSLGYEEMGKLYILMMMTTTTEEAGQKNKKPAFL